MQYLPFLGWNWRMLPDSSKFFVRHVQTFGYVFHDTNGKNHGKALKISWCFSNETCMVTHQLDCCGKDNLKKLYQNLDGRHQNGWKEAEHGSHVEQFEQCGHWRTTSFPDHENFGCTQRECKANETIIEQFKKMFESRISAGATEKLPGWEKPHAKTEAWSCNMEGYARECVERHCELANKKVEPLYKVSNLCLDVHRFRQEELESVGELSEVCSQNFL